MFITYFSVSVCVSAEYVHKSRVREESMDSLQLELHAFLLQAVLGMRVETDYVSSVRTCAHKHIGIFSLSSYT